MCAAILTLLGTAAAQEFRASISGVITDQTGASIAAATVTAINQDTGLRATAKSGAEGNYVLPQLPPGRYELTAEATGFRTYQRKGITLAVGDKANVQIRMEIGRMAESVTVTAELTGIESNQSVLGQLMDNKKVSELPLNGRQVFMLLQLSAGVVFTQQQFGATGFSGTRAWDITGNITIQGSRLNSNAFMLDGAPLGMNGQWDYAPLVDAVNEFKVASPANDASQGLTGGGVVNMTMKSGTNRIHGLASWFVRNNIFDANTTQTNRAAAEQPELKTQQHQWNSFAAMISGPAIRNKLFYAGNYEGFRERVPFPTTQTVPTLEQRAGDFSQTFNASSQLISIYDPLSTRAQGSGYVRDAFPGNRVPANRIMPVARNIMQYIPAPNIGGAPVTHFNNYASIPNVGRQSYDMHYVKVDYIWNEKHRTFASQTRNGGYAYRQTNGVPAGNPATTGGDPNRRTHYGATLDHVWTATPTTVVNARMSWDRFVQDNHQDSIEHFDGSQLGFLGRNGSASRVGYPQITFTNYLTIGSANARAFTPREVYSGVVDISKTAGAHFLKFGTRFGQNRFSNINYGQQYGNFAFNNAFTQRDPLRGDATSGNAMASFLLGFPASGGTDSNPQSTYENKFLGLYLQDDFRVTRRLTLNLGIRWDVQAAPSERYNRIIAGFDPNAAYTLGSAQAQGGLVFADSSHRSPFHTNWRDFQPRFGAAFQATRKMVWRAAYGLTFMPLNGAGGAGGVQQTGFARRTPYVATIGGGLNSYTPGRQGAGTLAIPFPEGILQPPGASLGPMTQVGQAITFQNPDYVIPRVHQFNVGFEYELRWKMLAEASYVGSRTRKFAVSRQLAAVSLDDRLKGFADPNYLNASVPNPFAGAPELAGTGLSSATVTRGQALRPYPQFSGVTMNGLPFGDSSYNALEIRLNKRLTNGLTMTASYTFAKMLEAVDYREPQYTTLTHELAAIDRPQHLTVFALYQLPIGRGKALGNHWSRPLDLALGNWQLNFMVEAMSGTPTALPDATPVRDPRLPDGQKSYGHWFNTCTQLANGKRSNCASPDEPVTWMQLKPNELRTYSEVFPNLRNDWKPAINASLFKEFPLTERMRLEFRAETFNAFNTPIYAGPTTGITSPQFGKVVLDQQNFARNMQFALRLRF